MIYPQSITGKYRRIKDYISGLLVMLYLGSSWLRWERGPHMPNQAVIIDLAERRAHIFGITIWPDELYLLTGALIASALGLFIATSLFGRIWCGYTCPHTVFVDLFVKIETFFQGDRNSRIKLDRSEWSSDKLRKKAYTHLAWILLSLLFSFGWVSYFYDAPTLLTDFMRLQVSQGGAAWLAGLTAITYLLAGFLRHRVCLYMCPYGRFQSAMLEETSAVVTYHSWRGEPRGSSVDGLKAGDCIDCGKCLQVCPMGIDIRHGLQLACIGCGLCIDACDSVMQKLNRPTGLIAYDSIISTNAKKHGNAVYSSLKRLLHPKVLLFALAWLLVATAIIWATITKEDTEIALLHDRSSLFAVLPDYSIRNTYTLKIANKTLLPRSFTLSNATNQGVEFKLQGPQQEYTQNLHIDISAGEVWEGIVFIKTPKDMKTKLDDGIELLLNDTNNNETYGIKSAFIYPEEK